MAWLVLVGFALQLYFDFSGYTDMAIGLGQMLGFRFVENFNYPYISKSIGEFWRRWHISLSSWFRDYVFYTLEFASRRTTFGGRVYARLRQPVNILIVFWLTGLWHGVTLNFILWGLVHGLALALEATGFGRWLKKAWRPLQHAYALLVILLGWVFFRSPDLAYAGQFLARLSGSTQGITRLPYSLTRPLPIVENSVWLALALGILFSLPVLPAVQRAWKAAAGSRPLLRGTAIVSADVFLLFLLFGSVAATVGSTFVASIYGGF
jgi:alginate O-acetyltransferase complex protein AlgI